MLYAYFSYSKIKPPNLRNINSSNLEVISPVIPDVLLFIILPSLEEPHGLNAKYHQHIPEWFYLK